MALTYLGRPATLATFEFQGRPVLMLVPHLFAGSRSLCIRCTGGRRSVARCWHDAQGGLWAGRSLGPRRRGDELVVGRAAQHRRARSRKSRSLVRRASRALRRPTWLARWLHAIQALRRVASLCRGRPGTPVEAGGDTAEAELSGVGNGPILAGGLRSAERGQRLLLAATCPDSAEKNGVFEPSASSQGPTDICNAMSCAPLPTSRPSDST